MEPQVLRSNFTFLTIGSFNKDNYPKGVQTFFQTNGSQLDPPQKDSPSANDFGSLWVLRVLDITGAQYHCNCKPCACTELTLLGGDHKSIKAADISSMCRFVYATLLQMHTFGQAPFYKRSHHIQQGCCKCIQKQRGRHWMHCLPGFLLKKQAPLQNCPTTKKAL